MRQLCCGAARAVLYKAEEYLLPLNAVERFVAFVVENIVLLLMHGLASKTCHTYSYEQQYGHDKA